MTDIQIKYWVNQENKRHNIAMERETATHDRAMEQAAASQAYAANRQAAVQERLATLSEWSLPVNLAYTVSQTTLNRAKEKQQRLESSVYSKFGALQASANWAQTRANTFNTYATMHLSNARAELTKQQAIMQAKQNATYYAGFWSNLIGDSIRSATSIAGAFAK